MIKAYHQVGTDESSEEERSDLLKLILEMGVLLPAIDRISRAEMDKECFGDADVVSLHARFRQASGVSLFVLREMAKEWVDRLPRKGSTRTMFNCVDLLAGDLGRIFLSIGDWYAVDNGFVFDAEKLIKMGARFRRHDLLGSLDANLERVTKIRFSTLYAARQAIEETIHDVIAENSLEGQEAIRALRRCAAAKTADSSHGCAAVELVWDGRLPIDLAVEVWENGKKLIPSIS